VLCNTFHVLDWDDVVRQGRKRYPLQKVSASVQLSVFCSIDLIGCSCLSYASSIFVSSLIDPHTTVHSQWVRLSSSQDTKFCRYFYKPGKHAGWTISQCILIFYSAKSEKFKFFSTNWLPFSMQIDKLVPHFKLTADKIVFSLTVFFSPEKNHHCGFFVHMPFKIIWNFVV